MPFYIGARYKNIGVAEYDKYHFCNDTFDASNDSYIFTNIEKMKKRRYIGGDIKNETKSNF